ncbi:MAG: hypothetical protein ACMG6S_19090 [Byssovorax sp.]
MGTRQIRRGRIVRSGGDARDRLGREYPVFDFAAGRFLDGERDPPVNPAAPVAVLAGIARLLVVGLEADFLDALAPLLGEIEIGLVTASSGAEPDWRRVLANYDGRVEPVGLSEIQRWAGRRSALLTFVYGTDGHAAHVAATWLRVCGPDVRTQFRALIGWDIFGRPMSTYPRWLVATSHEDFSHLVGR